MNNENALTVMNVMTNNDNNSVYAVSVFDKEEKVEMFNAVTNPTNRLSDCINCEISIKNVSITPVEIVNDDGEVVRLPRVVILSHDGSSYTATSTGIYNSIKNIYSIFYDELISGEINVRVKQKTTSNGYKTMILEVV